MNIAPSERIARRSFLAEAISDAVVRANERELHLAHEDVHVVARVAHEREAFAVARDVAVVLEQLGGIVALEQIRRAARRVAVGG